DQLPSTVVRPGKSPIAVRVRLSDGSGFDLTEAGTKKSLAAYIVLDPAEVPGVARLGPDPLADEFTREVFGSLLEGRRTQIKGLLRDQEVIAGVGNAYSDEILHVAKISPFAIAGSLAPDVVDRLYAALRDTLSSAVAAASGKPAKELKDAKRAGMRVHARTGQACPECGDVVREVSFADTSLQYCATCQTGGKPLADRRMSRLLK
ncbi:MAG: zinc finger domain-containing protein, partial [Terracoccus sp.]